MPGANRAFRFWLAPTDASDRAVEIRGIALVAAGYAISVAVFLALR
jgi:hypothetical protein